MLMKFKIITFCLLFTGIFFSCKKEELSNVRNSGTSGNSYVALLSKVIIDNQSVYEYIYNDSSRITQEKSKFHFIAHHYNSKGQLATTLFYGNDDILSSDLLVSQTAINSNVLVTLESGKKGGLITYEYDGNSKLTKTTYSRPLSASSEYSEFSYNNNRISRQTMYWNKTASGYIDYSYDARGNLIKEMLYNLPISGVAELITSTQYTFDNESNPYKSTSRLLIPGINTNQNNIIKEAYTIHLSAGQGADKVQITETLYEYNAMGYPVKKNGNVSYLYK